jgi:hypothetical protein
MVEGTEEATEATKPVARERTREGAILGEIGETMTIATMAITGAPTPEATIQGLVVRITAGARGRTGREEEATQIATNLTATQTKTAGVVLAAMGTAAGTRGIEIIIRTPIETTTRMVAVKGATAAAR